MMKHSYSALSAYHTCPHQYYRTRITREFVRQQGVEAAWGNQVHDAAEARVQAGKAYAMPDSMKMYGPPIDKVVAAFPPKSLQTEVEMGVDEFYQPAEFSDGYFRGKIDLLYVNADKAVVLDWKTGKLRHDVNQLKFYAMLTFLHYQDVRTILGMFYWLKVKKATTFLMWREQLPSFVSMFTAWANNVETESLWAPRPSGLCKKHCDVLSCSYNGRQ